MIKKTTRRAAVNRVPRQARRPVNAATNITAAARNRNASAIKANSFAGLSPEKRAFARQLQSNARRSQAIMGATNTSNIMARPDFLELLPLFVQNLLILDVFGSVAQHGV